MADVKIKGTENVVEFLGSESNRLEGTHFKPVKGHNGPPVLFMHGGGQTRHSWAMAAREVAAMGFDAISIDARGHGDSAWVESARYSFLSYRDDLICLAQQVADQYGDTPIVVGASMGGISAMLAQEAHNNVLFKGIILVDITHRMQMAGVNKIMGFMAQNMSDGFESVEAAADVIAAYLPNRPRPKNNDGLAKNLRQKADGRYYWHWDPQFMIGNENIGTGSEQHIEHLEKAARAIIVPTLLIRGQKSELISEESVQEFLTLVPHAQYIDINNAGHMVAGDKNDVFAKAVIDFIQAEF